MVWGAAGTLQAAQLVTFTRGQSIVVQSSEKKGAWYYFQLEGGGEIGVPASRVASVEEYEAPPPAPAGGAVPGPVAAPNPPAASAPGQPAPQAQSGSPGSPMAQAAPGQQADPGKQPDSRLNTASPGQDDWRYKVRMSGGPRLQQNPYSVAGQAGRVPFGVQRPGMGQQRRVPPGQQNPQN
jgi:translation initiation factor IF-2